MKHTLRSWLLTSLCLLGLIGLFASAPSNLFAQAADATASAGVLLDAATGAVIATPPPAPWYSDAGVINAVIALVTGLFAVWTYKARTAAEKEKTTAQKVNESLVIAIEAASKIPAVAEKEKEIKQAIQRKLTDLGVQPLVHRIVKDVT